MFGCCVAGRLLQTNLQQIDDTHAIFELPAASTINHICVFLLGTVPFPDGYGASVHFFWPGKGSQLLGMLSNDKPSAIFRLRGTFAPDTTTVTHNAFMQNAGATANIVAVLGLSIEPLEQIQVQLSSLHSAFTKPTTGLNNPIVLTEKIVKHFFNYLSSFVLDGGGITSENVVPMNAVRNWYDSFMRRLKTGGVGFLEGLSE